MQLLEERYPRRYKCLRYEMILSHYSEATKPKIEIHSYVEGMGWSDACKTFQDAIDNLERKFDFPEGIEDEEKEADDE